MEEARRSARKATMSSSPSETGPYRWNFTLSGGIGVIGSALPGFNEETDVNNRVRRTGMATGYL